MKILLIIAFAIILLAGCSDTPQDKMVNELQKRSKIHHKENIDYINFEILSIDTLEVGGLFYDAKVKATVKHKAFEKERIDTTQIMFSENYVIID